MSLISPRPHAERDLMGVDKYNLELVLKLTPGISNGSIVFRDEEKILHSSDRPRLLYDNVIAPYKAELEIWYLNNKNIRNYIILLFLTIYVVFKNESQIVFGFPNFTETTSTVSRLSNLIMNWIELTGIPGSKSFILTRDFSKNIYTYLDNEFIDKSLMIKKFT